MPLLLKVTLEGSAKPPVWRKIRISEEETFETLHKAIQAAFGWHDNHLWEFSPKPYHPPVIGPPLEKFFEEDENDHEDAGKIIISRAFHKPKDTFYYVYDLGDSWEHKIILQKLVGEAAPYPMCTAGKGSCPPEDCGGIHGYYHMVEAINNPNHDQHQEVLEWMGLSEGDGWDINSFDLDDVQAYMKKTFKK